jgi:hypothetical protein
MPLTKIQLEKLGIHSEQNKLNPTRYWCNPAQMHLNIITSDTLEDVISKIFNEGVRQGIREGQKKRSQQLNSLLNDI